MYVVCVLELANKASGFHWCVSRDETAYDSSSSVSSPSSATSSSAATLSV